LPWLIKKEEKSMDKPGEPIHGPVEFIYASSLTGDVFSLNHRDLSACHWIWPLAHVHVAGLGHMLLDLVSARSCAPSHRTATRRERSTTATRPIPLLLRPNPPYLPPRTACARPPADWAPHVPPKGGPTKGGRRDGWTPHCQSEGGVRSDRRRERETDTKERGVRRT